MSICLYIPNAHNKYGRKNTHIHMYTYVCVLRLPLSGNPPGVRVGCRHKHRYHNKLIYI